jgi:hypothetical protein
VNDPALLKEGPHTFSNPVKAKWLDSTSCRGYQQAGTVYNGQPERPRSANDERQQKEYNWLTVELVKWKMFTVR